MLYIRGYTSPHASPHNTYIQPPSAAKPKDLGGIKQNKTKKNDDKYVNFFLVA